LAAESKQKGEIDKKKYEKARTLKSYIDKIRNDYEEKMHSSDLLYN
jgi:DNA topoisomerase-1